MALYGSELNIDEDGLALYGENVARLLRLTGRTPAGDISKTVKKDLFRLKKRYDELDAIHGGGRKIPTVAEWLLDNFFLARCEGQKAAEELRQPVKLDSDKGTPALLWLCTCLVRCGLGRVTAARCRLFFQGCQTVYVLSGSELGLLVPTLRAAVLSELAALYGEGTLTEEGAAIAERLFTSLRLLSGFDFSELLQEIDKVEQLYRKDPSGIYPKMSEKTRAYYKAQTLKLAKSRGVNELRVAERVLFLSRGGQDEKAHLGYWLFVSPLGKKKSIPSGVAYIISNILLTVFLSLFIAGAFNSLLTGLLLLLPISEIVKFCLDLIMLNFLPPAHISRMELEEGVPPEGRTVCVISALLANEKSGERLARRLEEYRLANRSAGDNLLFGILADLPDGEEEVSSGDEAIIDAAKSALDALNEKYGGGFFFFIRPRVYNDRDKKFMAHERKRGAITDLARLVVDGSSSLRCVSGSLLALRGVRYILTLDEDTRLTPDAAVSFVGAMLHPLNKPVVSKKSGRVVSGHAVIQPRMSTELSSVGKSDFSRVFAGQGGSDPYGCDCSELYMDAFESGGFAGKGIIDAAVILRCLEGRIPENSVLSHDALEGAYLRGGLMSDVELLDGFPSSISSYFRRMHRWVRGDWQNSPWLFRRGQNFAPIEKFRLFDSLRRSLFPPMCFIALLAAFFLPGIPTAAAAFVALTSLCLWLIASIVRSLFTEESISRLRCRSHLIRGVNESLLQVLIKLFLLPYESFVRVTAAVTALWRMLVSGKNMLSWTPASVFESRGQNVLGSFGSMWFSVATGILLLFFSPVILGKTVGIIWILSPAAAFSLSRPKNKRQVAPSPEDRRYLLSCAVKIWSFFSEFCSPVDHFLPPDNYQERPPAGVAHRSSPTNIGLCLVSCLAAMDLGAARQEEALGIIENVLATLRRLPKWNGHLYNWYDTRTLKPLHPAYVSTVDSGNLAVCLMILREGLLELSLLRLVEQCDELLAPMSFTPLYDSRRRLFSIGMDTEKNELSKSYYDLMASEARTASFVAIVRGDVSRRHWRSLSRAQVQQGRHRGMVSWSGSMFEYLMPRLFFRSLPGSMIYETDRFCVGVQKNHTKKKKLPWGVSESAFYSLDPGLNYRYKAHGCGALALNRGMDKELVVSPYSSFLALSCGAGRVTANLRELEAISPQSKYGFWEAVDFSDSRTDGVRGETVRCVMAHHLGMSLTAIANCLCGDSMPRRLMNDPAVAAYYCLLEEKLPLGGVVLKRRETKNTEKPPRAGLVFWERRGEFADFANPECCALSNGSYNVLLTDTGSCRAQWKGIIPYYTPRETPAESHGFDLWMQKDGELVPLLPEPSDGESVKTQWDFTLFGGKLTVTGGDYRCQTVVSVSSEWDGERRRISVSSLDGSRQKCRLIVGFRPVLASYNDYMSHPAFWGLGLSAGYRDGVLVLKRLRRGTQPECFLCLAATTPMEFSARRELIPGRGGLTQALSALPTPPGGLRDPYICAGMELDLSSDGQSTVTLALAVGLNEQETCAAAQRILVEPDSRAADFPCACAKSLGMSEKQVEGALELLRTVTFPAPRFCETPRQELWRFGLSGDLPIVSREIKNSEDLETAVNLVLSHRFLGCLGHSFDLVFLTDEGGDYMRPMAASLDALRHSSGGGSPLIRTVDLSQDTSAISQTSVHPADRAEGGQNAQYVMSTNGLSPAQVYPEIRWDKNNSFVFYVNQSLPPRAWGNILTNGHFGFFATDCGTGHMWFENAREYHINRWLCDSLATVGTERLTFDGVTAFADTETHCKVSFGFGFARWEKEIGGLALSTECFAVPEVNARVLVMQWDGGPKRITWFTDLVLGGGESGRALSVEVDDGVITVRNADSPFPDFPFRVCAGAPFEALCTQREKWLKSEGKEPSETVDCLAVSYTAESPFILVCGCDEPKNLLELCWPQRAFSAHSSALESWRQAVSRLRVETPLPALDRLINGWLPYQAMACRLMGRCSIYQSGGATGFRDQLQDAVSLILLNPVLAKAQIIRCCRHQYPEGDVMHWWHELQQETRGVRTHCSDDLLWLPWALCEYVEKTGDESLVSVELSWLVSKPLREGERDRYEQAVLSDTTDTVLTHCEKALELIRQRGLGAHGLLKIGGGDWNDGMDMVGSEGLGESLWLSWFYVHTAHRFAALLRRFGESEKARELDGFASELGKAANEAWDGGWYLRGYFDDGTPLGSSGSDCCRIDSIAQSFAGLCPEAEKHRVNTALTSALEWLFDRENGIVKLFDPPFENADPYPGYIESYGPGFRENGGQYTHGAIWLLGALLREERTDEAFELLQALIPENKPGEVYGAEPYILAADVSSNPDSLGTAGWSWYTGAAGWLWRTVTEELFGVTLRDGTVHVSPRLPSSWENLPVSISLDGQIIWEQNSPPEGRN